MLKGEWMSAMIATRAMEIEIVLIKIPSEKTAAITTIITENGVVCSLSECKQASISHGSGVNGYSLS